MNDETGNAPDMNSGNAEVAPDTGHATEAPATQDVGHAAPELTREMVQGHDVFKELQSGFTKKSQRNKELETQNEQYQRALQDPLNSGITEAQMRQYLNMKGYDMRRLDAQQEDAYGDQSQVNQDAQILQHLGPVHTELNAVKANYTKLIQNQVVTELESTFPDWSKYEDDIKDNLKRYPHLGENREGIKQLYSMCVPPEVQREAILKEMQAEIDSKKDLSNATLPAASTPKAEAPDDDFTGDWDGAWEWAKRKHGLG